MPLQRLIEGYRDFVARHFREDASLYAELAANGQRPHAVVVACSDSRVSPNTLFQARPGELFVVRNVANLVPPPGTDIGTATLAGIEYAVRGLEVERVIILGHSRCGGIKALMDGPEKTGGEFPYVTDWVATFEPVRRAVVEGDHSTPGRSEAGEVGRATLVKSLENLRSHSWVAERVAAGRLELHAWYFRLSAGTLESYDPDSGRFTTLVGELETAD